MDKNKLPIKIDLPENFLNEETRCDHVITQKIKKVWAIELDLLHEFDRVCKKYNIKYCADGGTLLGAIRHKGIIPWDDDIDIAMTRSEFEKLNKIAPKEFKEPYFWQTEETDPSSARGHAQLRNSYTTGIINSERGLKLKFNQGIFIDIFPFDNIPDDSAEAERFYESIMEKHSIYSYRLFYMERYSFSKSSNNFLKRCIQYFIHCFFMLLKPIYNYKKPYKIFEKECIKYNDKPTEYIADSYMGIGIKRSRRFAKDFENLINVPFEFLEIPVFKEYDRNLKMLYGENYMSPVKGDNLHGDVFFDTEKSYREYI